MKKQISITQFFTDKSDINSVVHSSNDDTDIGAASLTQHNLTHCSTHSSSTGASRNATTSSTERIVCPNQPNENFVFPKRTFGKRERAFQGKWFENYRWIHYRTESDTVLCYICANAELKGNLRSVQGKDAAFISTGFSNWKKAINKFESHMKSTCHKTALTFESMQCKDVGAMLNEELEGSRKIERKYFIKVMETVQTLARQGIAFQGDDGNDNFQQLLLLRGKDDPEVVKRVHTESRKFRKYTHDQYQNELIDIMAQHVLRLKLAEIRGSQFYSIMADEYTDISNKEQLSLCLRWVNPNELKVYEDFVGFYELQNIESMTIVTAIKDALIRFDLPISKCRGQTYDGASNMMGKKSGVATKIQEIEPKALITHCHCHSLNLSIKSTTQNCKLLKDTLDTIREICILVKYSPKRERILGNIQENIETEEKSSTLDKLCPTRWTVRAKCYIKLMTLYDAVYELWDQCLVSGKLNRELKSRISGCQSQMETFSFYFGLNLGHRLYSITDNLSRALQDSKMSAVTGQRLARATLSTFENMRSDGDFNMFYELVLKKAGSHPMVGDPKVGRKRSKPNYSILQYVDGYDKTDPHHPITATDKFRSIYFEAIDYFISALRERFEQPTYHIYATLENFLLSILHCGNTDEGMKLLMETYSDDINVSHIETEMLVFKQLFIGNLNVMCFLDMLEHIQTLVEERRLIPNIMVIFNLLLVNPATSATPERTFSLARRLKTWQRSTMSQKRFSSLAILNFHKKETDQIDLAVVGNEFNNKSDDRFRHFGKFTPEDFI